MGSPWAGDLLRATLLLSLALLLGLLLDAVGGVLAAALAGLFLWHGRQAWLLLRYLRHPLHAPTGLVGVWEEAAFRAHYALRRARQRTRRISAITRRFLNSTKALPDAAVVIDARGDIHWFNDTARDLLALKRSDIGRNLGSLMRHPQILRLLENVSQDGFAEVPSLRDSNAVLEVRIINFGASDRLFLARDTTQVQRLLTMRQDFVANVSHELRTPLTVIVGYLETLADVDDPDPGTIQTLVKRLEPPTLRMKSLVEELLLLSRLDTSGMPTLDELDPVDVTSVLRGIVSEAREMSGDRHEIVLDCEPGVRILGLERELHSAFMNLVVNAIRYSPDGGTILVSWWADDDGAAHFSVADEGIGIAEEHIHRLTERFYRVDVGRSREAGGTGLGLAIVKHVLRRHGSELGVESELGVGSTFRCTLAPNRVIRSAPRDPRPATDALERTGS